MTCTDEVFGTHSVHQASCDLFGLTKDDLVEQVKDIITVGEFYAFAAGGQIIVT